MAPKRTEAKTSKTPRAPATRRRRTPAVALDDVAVRAYFLHLEGGEDPFENWLRAERELTKA